MAIQFKAGSYRRGIMDPFINIIILLIILYVVWSVYRWAAGAVTQPFRRYRQAKLPGHPKLANSVKQFVALTNHIDTAFNQNTRMSAAQKKSLRAEIKQVQEHLLNLMWKMESLHILRTSIKDAANQFDLMSMQRKLQTEIDRSMEVLEQ